MGAPTTKHLVLIALLAAQALQPACWNVGPPGDVTAPQGDVGTDADTNSDMDSDTDADTGGDSGTDTDMCTDTGDTDTCCPEVITDCFEYIPNTTEEVCLDQADHIECWYEDALDDGILCEEHEECLSGECDLEQGLCTCCSQADCNDGDTRNGVCVTEVGVCGPSWCNGYRICSAWGGCEWWHEDPDITPSMWADENSLHCCEYIYPFCNNGTGEGFHTDCE